MDETSFRRFGGACAIGAALCAVVYAVLLILNAPGDVAGLTARVQVALANRGLSTVAGLLLALTGLLMTGAVAALHERVADTARGWTLWATALGLLGAVMMAAHGYWDYLRVPVLLRQWQTGDTVRQGAIATFSGVANPVDPRGFGSFLLVGLFVVVVARLILAGEVMPKHLGQLGLVYGVLLIVLFLTGLFDVQLLWTVLGALTVGLVGPIWWLLVGRELLRA